MASDKRDMNMNSDRNPDAITGSPGSHPVGTGVGAAGGGAAGAAIGAAVSGPAAPAGAVVGAVIGAVAGGLAGKGAAEAVNPTAEDAYWRENFASRPYYESTYTYDEDYRPAYEYGWRTRSETAGNNSFDEAEPVLKRGWDTTKSNSRLSWEKAKLAAKDAWSRLDKPDRDSSSSRSSGFAGTPRSSSGNRDNPGQ